MAGSDWEYFWLFGGRGLSFESGFLKHSTDRKEIGVFLDAWGLGRSLSLLGDFYHLLPDSTQCCHVAEL